MARSRSCRSSTSPSSATRSAASSTRSRPSCPCRSSATAGPRASSSGRRSSSASGRTSTSSPASTTAGSSPSASGTSIATSFHPELAGETRFHRLVATMAAEHDDPGEGSGRRPHPTRAGARRGHVTGSATRPASARAPTRQGPRRPADRPRRARRAVAPVPERRSAATRSLGLPVSGRADRRVQPVPAAARRVPAARPDVRLRGGAAACRA